MGCVFRVDNIFRKTTANFCLRPCAQVRNLSEISVPGGVQKYSPLIKGLFFKFPSFSLVFQFPICNFVFPIVSRLRRFECLNFVAPNPLTVWILDVLYFPVLKPLTCGRQSRRLGWTYRLPGGQKLKLKLSLLSETSFLPYRAFLFFSFLSRVFFLSLSIYIYISLL